MPTATQSGAAADTAGTRKVPTWFRVVAGVSLLWMLFGVMAWFMDLMMSDAALAEMTEAQRRLYEARPQWIFVVYGIAIFTGLAGAIALVMRKAWATTAFAISLAAVVIQFGYMFLVMNAIGAIGAAAALPFPVVIFAIGVALLWLSRDARARGWLT